MTLDEIIETLTAIDEYRLIEPDMRALRRAINALEHARELRDQVTRAYPIAELHEGHGNVLLWHRDHGEPPVVGHVLDDDFDASRYTHFTLISNPEFPDDE